MPRAAGKAMRMFTSARYARSEPRLQMAPGQDCSGNHEYDPHARAPAYQDSSAAPCSLPDGAPGDSLITERAGVPRQGDSCPGSSLHHRRVDLVPAPDAANGRRGERGPAAPPALGRRTKIAYGKRILFWDMTPVTSRVDESECISNPHVDDVVGLVEGHGVGVARPLEEVQQVHAPARIESIADTTANPISARVAFAAVAGKG